ncbi:hypothetical protein ACQ4PT_058925 [Festuca glaucescens]
MASTAAVPEVALLSGNARPMPAIGMGMSKYLLVPETTRDAVLSAMEVGLRHSDTASLYGSERPLGEAVAEAVRRGLVASREEVFITSKLWCTQRHPHFVLPSLQESLHNLQLEYVDLYLIDLSVSLKPGPAVFPAKLEDAMPFVWREMEECHRLGIAKAVGVSNFTTSHLDKILALAIQYPYNSNGSLLLPLLLEVALRWIYEQGVSPIVRSFSKERLKQNLEIFCFFFLRGKP